jgi:hypothetical protein
VNLSKIKNIFTGPRWIGRRGEAGGPEDGKPGEKCPGPMMEAAQVTGVQLCRPRELMPDSCAGHANHTTATSSSLSESDHTVSCNINNGFHLRSRSNRQQFSPLNFKQVFCWGEGVNSGS